MAHLGILLLQLLSVSFTEAVAPRTVELQIMDGLSPAANVTIVLSYGVNGSLVGRAMTAVTDANGFVTVVLPSRMVRVAVPDLSPHARVLKIPDEEHVLARWQLSPRDWLPAAEDVVSPARLLAVTNAGNAITFTLDCWEDAFAAGYGNNCKFCENIVESGHFTYACTSGTTGPWNPTCSFVSPVPASAVVTDVQAVVISKNCSGTRSGNQQLTLTYATSLNGTQIGEVHSDSSQNCNCSAGCHQDAFVSSTHPDGFPGYVPTGVNVFGFDVSLGDMCVERVEMTLTYVNNRKTLDITDVSDPIIPSRSGLVNDCVQYRSDISLSARDSGAPASGLQITLESSRNTAGDVPDTLTPPRATDQAGTTSSVLTTRKQGLATFKATAPDYAPDDYMKAFMGADFENQFLITGYGLPSEADFVGGVVTNPCGLQGTFNSDFLYSNRGVLMEGSGESANGSIITIDWNATPRPRRNNVCFRVDTCPRTANGTCAVVGTTIAVDTAVVPFNAQVNIDAVGLRTAQDTGGRIRGEHIDVYVGAGRANISNFGRNNRTVRYVGGGGACN